MKIGLIGFGFMGKTHAYAVESLKFYYKDIPFDAHISAVCTAHEQSAQKAAKDFGFDYCTCNEDDIINDDSIDIIDICTPNVYHYETLKKAIAKGKHIYCEKPLCVTYEQAKEIEELAKKADIKCQIVFNNRFLAPIMRAKEIIDEGRLGRILTFRSAYLHSSATDISKNAGWKQNRDICGGGVLFDLGSHAIDLIYYLCGEFESVIGKSQIAHEVRKGMNGEEWKTNADEAFYMIATLKNGAVGTVEASKVAVGTNDDFTVDIYGERGALKFDLMQPNYLYFYDNTAQNSDMGGYKGFTRIECVGRYPLPGGTFPGAKAPVGWIRGHIGSMYSFLDCIYNDKTPEPSFSDAAHVQYVMEKAYESDRK